MSCRPAGSLCRGGNRLFKAVRDLTKHVVHSTCKMKKRKLRLREKDFPKVTQQVTGRSRVGPLEALAQLGFSANPFSATCCCWHAVS